MTQLILHRGFSSQAPENSLAAFKAATGVAGIETDLWLTKDNQWIVLHDETLDRMTSGVGKVADYNLAELTQFRLTKGNKLAQYPQEKIPTLAEYLTIVVANQARPIIEIKAGDDRYLQTLLTSLARANLPKAAIIISFHYDILLRIRALNPTIELQFLVDRHLSEQHLQKALALGHAGLDLDQALVTPAVVQHAHQLGLPINVWTVNSQQKADELIAAGVDYITSNYKLKTEGGEKR